MFNSGDREYAGERMNSIEKMPDTEFDDFHWRKTDCYQIVLHLCWYVGIFPW